MPVRSLVLAVLGALWLASPPALAASSTVKQKFEKKIAHYAQPIAELDFTKPRGLCTCGDDTIALPTQTGLLAYTYQSGIGLEVPLVVCEIPVFDGAGALAATQLCEHWTLLRR
jgi:hypothetical protein